jgi:arylsulfatase A
MKNPIHLRLSRFLPMLLACLATLRVTAQPSRPNIILILADDVSAKEFTAYGDPVHTPALEQLAASGIRFQTAWSTPLCGPSRAMLQTGKYAHNQYYYNNLWVPSTSFLDDSRHLPILRMAQEAGYTTGMFGKMHHEGDAAGYGADCFMIYRHWEGYDGPHQQIDTVNPNRDGMYGVSWYWHPGLQVDGTGLPTTADDFGPDLEAEHIVNFIEANRDGPFMVYWPANLVHKAREPGTGVWYYPEVPEVDSSGNPTGNRLPGTLESNLRYLDFLVGKIKQKVEDLDLSDETIIIYTGDNGTPGYGKGRLDNEVALRVPFVVSGGPVASLGVSDALLDFTDIWPTVAELIEYPGAHTANGHSFAPLILGRDFDPREFIHMEFGNARWIRTADWLLDGEGRLWDSRGIRNEADYVDVSESDSSDSVAARIKLDTLLLNIPQPDYFNPVTEAGWNFYWERTDPVNAFRSSYAEGHIFEADFERSQAGGQNLSTSHLLGGSPFGIWIVREPEESGIVANPSGTNQALLTDLGNYDLRPVFTTLYLGDGEITVELDFVIRRQGIGRDHRWSCVAEDNTIGLQLEVRDVGTGVPGVDRWHLVALHGGGTTVLSTSLRGTQAPLANAPELADFDQVRIVLSNSNFDVFLNGAPVGSDLPYLSGDFADMNRLVFRGLDVNSGGYYDNITVSQMPSASGGISGIETMPSGVIKLTFDSGERGLSRQKILHKARLRDLRWTHYLHADGAANPFLHTDLSYSTFVSEAAREVYVPNIGEHGFFRIGSD